MTRADQLRADIEDVLNGWDSVNDPEGRVAAALLAVLEGPTDEMVEAASAAMTAKLKEHPMPAPAYGGNAEAAMFWGVTVDEVARVALQAALAQIGEPRNLDLAAQTPVSPPKLGEPLQEDTE